MIDGDAAYSAQPFGSGDEPGEAREKQGAGQLSKNAPKTVYMQKIKFLAERGYTPAGPLLDNESGATIGVVLSSPEDPAELAAVTFSGEITWIPAPEPGG